MLRPAHLYQEEIIEKMYETWYNPAYKYYYDMEMTIPNFNVSNGQHQFASVDEKGNVIGYLSYNVYIAASRANCFGIISFDKGNLTFIKDVYQMIDECFTKFGLNSVEWMVFENNSEVLKAYRTFVKHRGGREVGILHDATKAYDNKLNDVIIFEILAKDYFAAKGALK